MCTKTEVQKCQFASLYNVFSFDSYLVTLSVLDADVTVVKLELDCCCTSRELLRGFLCGNQHGGLRTRLECHCTNLQGTVNCSTGTKINPRSIINKYIGLFNNLLFSCLGKHIPLVFSELVFEEYI